MAERSMTEFGVQARELAGIGRTLGSLSIGDARRIKRQFSTFDMHAERANTWEDSPYRELAVVLEQNLGRDMKRAGFSPARQRAYHGNRVDGGKVMSKILRFAVPAYVPFTQGEGRDPKLAELGDALLGGYSTLKPFAATNHSRALEKERVFGVSPIDTMEPMYERIPFLFERDGNGDVGFVPSPYSMSIAANRILHMERTLPNMKNTSGMCPAFGKLLEAQWNQAVEICMEVPSLFQLDFAQLAPDTTFSS